MKQTYYKTHIDQLRQETEDRFSRLLLALHGTQLILNGKECINLDGPMIRIAVDDFKTILVEIRRLK